MIQVRNVCTVKTGSFPEFVPAADELMDISRQRGWAPGTLLTPPAEVNAEAVWQVEYPDLTTMQAGDRGRAHSDPVQ